MIRGGEERKSRGKRARGGERLFMRGIIPYFPLQYLQSRLRILGRAVTRGSGLLLNEKAKLLLHPDPISLRPPLLQVLCDLQVAQRPTEWWTFVMRNELNVSSSISKRNARYLRQLYRLPYRAIASSPASRSPAYLINTASSRGRGEQAEGGRLTHGRR